VFLYLGVAGLRSHPLIALQDIPETDLLKFQFLPEEKMLKGRNCFYFHNPPCSQEAAVGKNTLASRWVYPKNKKRGKGNGETDLAYLRSIFHLNNVSNGSTPKMATSSL